jgi:hypothetical protein
VLKGLAEFTKTTLIGGVLVVLPIYVSWPGRAFASATSSLKFFTGAEG